MLVFGYARRIFGPKRSDYTGVGYYFSGDISRILVLNSFVFFVFANEKIPRHVEIVLVRCAAAAAAGVNTKPLNF